jgi:alkyl hydroperoxide reductase subunit F
LNFTRIMERVDRVTHEDGVFTVHTSSGSELESKAVIVATGARQQWLGVPGEREYLSRGLCYSAISYAPLFIGKKTVVVGDGELALRAAGELAMVAEQVHVVGPSGSVLETPLGQKLQRSKNVTILEGLKVSRVLGNGYCNRVVVHNDDGGEFDLEADGTFIEMALLPNTQAVEDLVDLDEQGRIEVDCFNHTRTPGLFAAGDVTTICTEQVLVAVGEGAKAALSAYDYLLPTL